MSTSEELEIKLDSTAGIAPGDGAHEEEESKLDDEDRN